MNAAPMVRGRFTLRSAGFFFLLSAVFEVISLKSCVPFRGEILSGGAAIVYHLLYALIFGTMGVALWAGLRRGLAIILGGTAVFTADKLILLTNPPALTAHIDQLLAFSPELARAVGTDQLTEAFRFVTWLILISWWGFALYVYRRREYFHPPESTVISGRKS